MKSNFMLYGGTVALTLAAAGVGVAAQAKPGTAAERSVIEDELKREIGRQVEATGYVEVDESAGTPRVKDLPRMNISQWTRVADFCPGPGREPTLFSRRTTRAASHAPTEAARVRMTVPDETVRNSSGAPVSVVWY